MNARTTILGSLAVSLLLASSAMASPPRHGGGHSSYGRASHNNHHRSYGHSSYNRHRNYGYSHSRSARHRTHRSSYSYRHSSPKHYYGSRAHHSAHYSPSHDYYYPSHKYPSHSYRYDHHVRHSYPHHSPRHYGSSVRYGTSVTVYSAAPRPVVVVPAKSAEPHTAQHGAGWDALMYGKVSLALDRFGDEAVEHPTSALPKVGYAIAAAKLGLHDQAAWAMRKALAYDAAVLNLVPRDPAITALLTDLEVYYTNRIKNAYDDADTRYMLESVRAMLYAGEMGE